MIRQFKMDENDIFLQWSSYSFDVSVSEIFTSFSVGGTLVLCEENKYNDPNYVNSLISNHKISSVFLVTTFFHKLVDYLLTPSQKLFKPVKRMFVAGESLSAEAGLKYCTHFEGRLYNLYGPNGNNNNCRLP